MKFETEMEIIRGGEESPDSEGRAAPREKETEPSLEDIRRLVPAVARSMRDMLEDPETPASARVRICEIVLNRTFGRAPASVTISGDGDRIEESRAYILSLFPGFGGERKAEGGEESKITPLERLARGESPEEVNRRPG